MMKKSMVVALALGTFFVGNAYAKDVSCPEVLVKSVEINDPFVALDESVVSVLSCYGNLLVSFPERSVEVYSSTSGGTEAINLARAEKWLNQAKLHMMHAGATEEQIELYPRGSSYQDGEVNKLSFEISSLR